MGRILKQKKIDGKNLKSIQVKDDKTILKHYRENENT